MSVNTSAGTLLSISAAAPASFTAAGYAALTYTPIGEIVDPGEFGRKYAVVTHTPVGTRGTQKFKGSFNEGAMNLQMGLDTADAGQILLQAAVNSDAPHSFKVTLPSGAIFYFQGMAMEFVITGLTVDSITSASCALELTTSKTGVGVVRVDPV